MPNETTVASIIINDYDRVLAEWLKVQTAEGVKRTDLVSGKESEQQSRELLSAMAKAMPKEATDDDLDLAEAGWEPVRDALEDIAENRTQRGVSTTEMGWFIGALKQPLFKMLQSELGEKPRVLMREIWNATRLIDQISLHAIETLVSKREAIIERQRAEMTEVAAPVVKIWDSIVTVPLIGTLDSFRAQTVMENLLDAIVQWEAEVAIIDITGVSTVDTMVAQHLLKTASAVRLMGAECVICGISPKIAQTVVNLGVELPNIVTRVDLESGLAYAFDRLGVQVGRGSAGA
ncbi:STAS domain-containing protein [Notoacmeibacter sp. MSK16QG-6]|uniref:STAS domain-containing protein n=1 Tax=Notoacmeibacter sp. MSK16QG-6 TaxID=2957982 RepID=UPI00209FADAD|nr:STAS domain-containing protein [Notoacmeibacter sp. MSK16QG-6]MCP1198576.1 STAS domain-containing protein [Notoacmeibacter sp. MSK16QG-6]